MNAYRMTSHDRVGVKKICQPLFEDIRTAITHKIADYAMALDDHKHDALFKTVSLIEDPNQEFSVKADLAASAYEGGVSLTVELLMFSRQVRRFHRLPTAEEIGAMHKNVASGRVVLTRYTGNMSTFKKGITAKNIEADVAKALQEGGAIDQAIERAKLVSRHNFKTAMTLAKLKKVGWTMNGEQPFSGNYMGAVAVGEKVFFDFGCWLTPEQAIALHEAMTPVIEANDIPTDKMKSATYAPRVHAGRYWG